MRALHPLQRADLVDGGVESRNVLCLYHRQKIKDTGNGMKRAQFWHALQRCGNGCGGFRRNDDGHMRAHHAPADLFREPHGIADDHPAPLQAFHPRLHGGAGELQAAGGLRMADAGVLPQKGNQGAVCLIEHHIDQLERQYADNYSAFRQVVYGVLHGFAFFSCHHQGGSSLMKSILVIGAGKIGSTIVDMLNDTGDYTVTVADASAEALAAAGKNGIKTVQLDFSDAVALQNALKGHYAVLSAAPYHLTGHVAQAARLAGVNYFDLTEDVATTRMVKELSEGATTAFIPQCGLAPGFISIVAHDIASRFDKLDTVRLRVGALPQYPSNALSYNLTWSTDGVINEYIERCEAVVDGKLREVPAMEELEEFSLDGTRYEAFNTSGGLGTLCETLEGKVRNLNYKTIRYPGHCALMRVLLNDLQLRNRREVLKDILENAVPATMQDMVIVFVTVTGERDGRYVQETYARSIYGQKVAGTQRTAIQVTTAAGICAMLDLLVEGKLPGKGFVRQEEISLDAFLANRFGRVYAGVRLDQAGEPGAKNIRLDAVA